MGIISKVFNVASAEFSAPPGLIPNVARYHRTHKLITFNFTRSGWKQFKPLAALWSAYGVVGPLKITIPMDLAEWAYSQLAPMVKQRRSR